MAGPLPNPFSIAVAIKKKTKKNTFCRLPYLWYQVHKKVKKSDLSTKRNPREEGGIVSGPWSLLIFPNEFGEKSEKIFWKVEANYHNFSFILSLKAPERKVGIRSRASLWSSLSKSF